MLHRLLFSLVLLSLASPAFGAVRAVPAQYTRITDAIAASGPGDTVTVAAGTYAPSVNGESFPLVLTASGPTLLGAGMMLSILDAESTAKVLTMSGGRVSGFTMTGGYAFLGAGVSVVGGSPEIDNNLILRNAARDYGSGIDVDSASVSAWIHHNILWENFDLSLVHSGDPHGIQIHGATPVVENNLIGRGDSNALLFGGSSNPVIRNNIFFENGIPALRGRGICALSTNPGTITHNLFYGNQIAAILLQNPGLVDQTGEQANDNDPLDQVYGNLDADPLFVDADGMDWNLQSASPAIDAGDPVSPLDPDGTVADIGPLYFNQATASVPGDGLPSRLVRAYPNPFLSSTRLDLAGTESAEVWVADVTGRRILTLWSGDLAANAGLIWNGRDDRGHEVPSGVYFLAVQSGGRVQTARVLKLR